MKRTLCAVTASAMLLLASTVKAQEITDSTANGKKKHYVSISNKGIHMGTDSTKDHKHGGEAESHKRLTTSIAVMDLGFNIIQDKTNYADAEVKSYLNVPAAQQNKNLFELNTWKSINVNIYPIMARLTLARTKYQKIYVSSGVGLQLYNFRYDKPVQYVKDYLVPGVDNPTGVMLDSISFKKNKLALNYLSVPVMFTFKTRIDKKHWLVYGVGATGGYRIGSWTKQVSSQRGKMKTSDDFGLANFNACVNAEIGIDDMLRFFGSYQVTSLFDNKLEQHPICFGFRINGI